MNRRSYIKNSLLLTLAGISGVGLYKYYDINEFPGLTHLLGKREILAEIVETIIPATDTPGAKEALVHDYIINVISNCYPARQQNKFYNGIESVENYALDIYNLSFIKCDKQQRNAVLKHFADHDGYSIQILNKINNKIFGKPFYSALRSITVEGYCLSRIGATQGLAYDYIPGTYQSCTALTPNQKSWATK